MLNAGDKTRSTSGHVQRLWQRMPRPSARLHVSIGLASLVSTVVLVSLFLGFVPDRVSDLRRARIELSESVAALGSMLLRRGDIAGMRSSLESIIERHEQLLYVRLRRDWDNDLIHIGGEQSDTPTERVAVPLLRGGRQWGSLEFVFAAPLPGFWARLRQPPFGLLVFCSLCSLPLFYVYLGRVLKELDPSQAVPGRVRTALDTIAESLLVIDRAGNIVLANAAFSELAGKSTDRLIGTRIDSHDWLRDPAEDTLPWDLAIERAETTRNHLIGFTDANGQVRKFLVNCSPVLSGDDEVNGVLVSMDDVTLLEEKEMLLRESMEAAEAANRAKSAFLSSMSHEIRTPMTAILGFTEVLRRGFNHSEDARQRYLATISRSGQHLLELINDVLDLSKVESGAMEVELIECQPARIAYEVIQVLGVKAREKGIDLDLQIHSDLPEYIISDPSRLRQIITNLTGNAIKFTDEGRVSIAVVCDAEKDQDLIRFRVTDSGIGMSESQLESIFDEFSQADASINRRFGGTGLGLSISRKLAVALGGDIGVTSAPGRGSTFTVSLPTGDLSGVPALSPREVFEALKEEESAQRSHWTFAESRVLVVDDGAENRELLSVVLEEHGLCIALAENGQDALERLDSDTFDVILMDIQMPVMDGYEAVGRMRERGIGCPIVALTANAMKGYEQKILDSGFSHYMTKPIDIDALVELLARLLGGQTLSVDDGEGGGKGEGEGTGNMAGASADDSDEPLLSTLAQNNPRFEQIARSFLTRLDDRLEHMDQAFENRDWQSLAELAHWLKGSGGTVGFAVLTEPARALEQAAKAAQHDNVRTSLHAIRQLRRRLCAAPEQSDAARTEAQPLRAATSADEVSVTKQASDTAPAEDAAASCLVSTLPMDNPRFRAIVERFMPRLQHQMNSLHRAVEEGDWDAVRDLAHWLKGSAGNVGYGAFTEVAATLENQCKAGEAAGLDELVHRLDVLTERAQRGYENLPPLQRSA